MPRISTNALRQSARFILKKVVEPKTDGKWYPAEHVPRPASRKFTPGKAVLRKSITPGTVLILLAGRYRGRRVVFLKQLPSGLLLVTGPFSINRVPLKRVDQRYVIATSTKLDVSGVRVPESVNDDSFRSDKAKKIGKGKEAFLAARKTATVTPQDRKTAQDGVDAAIKAKLSAEQTAYLSTKFALTHGQKPHELNF